MVVVKSLGYALWEQFSVPIHSWRKYDCVIYMMNTGPVLFKTTKYMIGYIHDVIYMKSKEEVPYSKSIYKYLGRMYRKLVVPIFAKKCDIIFTVSEFSKNDIIKSINYKSKNIKVIYNGFEINSKKSDLGKRIVEDPYILFLASIDYRKNTDLMINYFSKLIKFEEFNNYKLVLCGIENIENTHYHNMIKNQKLYDNIISLGKVSDDILIRLYKDAQVFIFLSSYEGFGLPLLEAMSMHTPVISSNLTCLPEIGGEAVLYVDPFNEVETLDKTKLLLTNSSLRKELINKGHERVKLFNWDKSAENILQYIDKLK